MSLTDIPYGKVMKIVKYGEILSHKAMKFMSKLWPKWSFLVGHCRGQVNGSLKNSANLELHTMYITLQHAIHYIYTCTATESNSKIKHSSSKVKFDYSEDGIYTLSYRYFWAGTYSWEELIPIFWNQKTYHFCILDYKNKIMILYWKGWYIWPLCFHQRV